MKLLYEPLVQARIDAYHKRILEVEKAHKEEYDRKVEQDTRHLRNALKTLLSENEVVSWELNPFEDMESVEINNEEKNDE